MRREAERAACEPGEEEEVRSSRVGYRTEVSPIFQSEPSLDLGRLTRPALAAAAPRRRPDLPRLPRPWIPRWDALSPAVRRVVAGPPVAPDPDPMHLGETLLAHPTGPWLRAYSQPFYSVCRNPQLSARA